MVKLVISDEHTARRLRCPEGHTSIGPTNNHWLCASCARYGDGDAEYNYAVDAKTKEKLHRDDVEVSFDVPGCNPA